MSVQHSPLGKISPYTEHYDPSLLFPIPRAGKRAELGLHGTLPFFGSDIWNAYELSWLNPRGKPEIALARFTVPADTPNLVESKSLKLYLNSYNQTRMDSAEAVRARIETDLSAAAGGRVSVVLMEPTLFAQQQLGELEGTLLDRLDLDIDCYTPDPGLLKALLDTAPVEETLTSNLLKSNCLVTGQPDWASVQIHYRGAPIDHAGLLRYLISFRRHNEFHEQCVERIFMDIWTRCRPSALTVYARYTRRGGLDINPFRTSHSGVSPSQLRGARQ
jgi:7-cyano-7-deazaguanine reductase